MSQEERLKERDGALIRKCLKGDETALTFLFKHYLRPVYIFVFRLVKDKQDAEEITQETFLKAWRNLKKFDLKKSFRTWIFSIAKNTAFDFLKKKKEILLLNDEENSPVLEMPDPGLLPSEILDQKKLKEILEEAIQQLPLKYQMVLFLHYNDHFTFQEIAEILDESINTVKSRHYRALRELKKLLCQKKYK